MKTKLSNTRLMCVRGQYDGQTVIFLYRTENKELSGEPLAYIPHKHRNTLVLLHPKWLYNLARCKTFAKFVNEFGKHIIDFPLNTKYALFDLLEKKYGVTNCPYDKKERETHSKRLKKMEKVVDYV